MIKKLKESLDELHGYNKQYLESYQKYSAMETKLSSGIGQLQIQINEYMVSLIPDFEKMASYFNDSRSDLEQNLNDIVSLYLPNEKQIYPVWKNKKPSNAYRFRYCKRIRAFGLVQPYMQIPFLRLFSYYKGDVFSNGIISNSNGIINSNNIEWDVYTTLKSKVSMEGFKVIKYCLQNYYKYREFLSGRWSKGFKIPLEKFTVEYNIGYSEKPGVDFHFNSSDLIDKSLVSAENLKRYLLQWNHTWTFSDPEKVERYYSFLKNFFGYIDSQEFSIEFNSKLDILRKIVAFTKDVKEKAKAYQLVKTLKSNNI